MSSSHRGPRAGLALPLFPPLRDFLLHLSPLHLRIGRKASILIQLLLFALVGLATAFVPSFELYVVMRFAVATAVAGYALTNVTLREYLALKPSATGRGLGDWHHSPDCLRGPWQVPTPPVVTPVLPGPGLRPQP